MEDPEKESPLRSLILRTLLALGVMVGILSVLPLGTTLIVSRFLALTAIVHLMWEYHRLADWSAVAIGRSTMAIKSSILVLALAANLRSLDHESLVWETALEVASHSGFSVAAAEIGVALGWLCMVAALVLRSRLVVELQHRRPSAAMSVPLKKEG